MQMPGFMNRCMPFFDALNARLLGSPRLVTPEVVATMAGRAYHVSNARARKELGWAPKIPLRDSMTDTMRSIRALRRAEGKRRMV